ncbi:MAG: hypothetical protein ACTMII_05745 [Brachybacterium sp.]|uniref:hypothetical protein n=1 Tax=unclassified Brachybacterium TaxID=2623841 RepID=UPI003F907294
MKVHDVASQNRRISRAEQPAEQPEDAPAIPEALREDPEDAFRDLALHPEQPTPRGENLYPSACAA